MDVDILVHCCLPLSCQLLVAPVFLNKLFLNCHATYELQLFLCYYSVGCEADIPAPDDDSNIIILV